MKKCKVSQFQQERGLPATISVDVFFGYDEDGYLRFDRESMKKDFYDTLFRLTEAFEDDTYLKRSSIK